MRVLLFTLAAMASILALPLVGAWLLLDWLSSAARRAELDAVYGGDVEAMDHALRRR